MQRIDVDQADDARVAAAVGPDVAWRCGVCGRPRLCPYAAPRSGDPLQACLSCGDLLARDPRDATTARAVSIAEGL